MSEGVKDSIIQSISAEDLRARLANKENGHWYLILDNSLLDTLANKPQFFKSSDWEFLLDNTSLAKMRKDGAIVAKLSPDSPWLNWFFTEEATNVAILLNAQAQLKQVCEYFKNHLFTEIPYRDRKLFFRFYDPRNMKVFLESLSTQELQVFLGLASAFFWKTEADINFLFFAQNKLPIYQSQSPYWVMSESSLQALDKSILPQTIKLIKNKLASISELKVEIRILGSKGIEDLIRHAIDISQAKGLISVKNYQDHAEMMLKFGQFFETDPQHCWVGINPPNETLKERWIRYLDFMHEAAEDFRGDGDDGWPPRP